MNLREIRKEKGLTLRDIQKMTGISMGYLSRVERGLDEPSKKVKILLCMALKRDFEN